MGLRTIVGHEAGCERPVAIMFDSCGMRAFGPIFDTANQVEAFLDHLGTKGTRDARYWDLGDLFEEHRGWVEAGYPGWNRLEDGDCPWDMLSSDDRHTRTERSLERRRGEIAYIYD